MVKIFIAEGDQLTRELFWDFFDGNSDYQISLFTSGAAVLDACPGKNPPCDLVITSIAMFPVNGLELIEKLKERFPRLPIILISGSIEKPEHHADLYLEEPINIEELPGVIQKLLKQKAATQAA